MTARTIADSLRRVQAVLARRPETGLHDDAPATCRWQGGARAVTRHPDGHSVATDMPGEFGGAGDEVSPGWLFRAGIASCATTSIVFMAAAEGVELSMLEVKVGSRSDARGLFGMQDGDGTPVYGGPGDMTLDVRVAAAAGIEPARLHRIVEAGVARSPLTGAVTRPTPLAVRIDIATG